MCIKEEGETGGGVDGNHEKNIEQFSRQLHKISWLESVQKAQFLLILES